MRKTMSFYHITQECGKDGSFDSPSENFCTACYVEHLKADLAAKDEEFEQAKLVAGKQLIELAALRATIERLKGLLKDVDELVVAKLRAENERLKAPVSDEEWEHRYDPDCDREYVLREDVDALISARAQGEAK